MRSFLLNPIFSPAKKWGFFLIVFLVIGYPAAAPAGSIYLPLVIKAPTLQNGDFENGPDGAWMESSTNFYSLILPIVDLNEIVPQGGSWAVWLGGDDYETSTVAQPVYIPADAATLDYYYWIESYEIPENCGFDQAYVRFGSTTLQTHILCEPNNTNQWVLGKIDLTAFRGQINTLVFLLVNDDIDPSNFFLDTVSISTTAGQ